jgi:hypothetical protein
VARVSPQLREGPFRTLHGIGAWKRDGADIRDRFVVLGGVAAPEIPSHSIGIGADDEEVAARPLVAVAGARWEHENIAGLHPQHAPAGAAEHNRRAAADDAQHLVGSRVEVVKREDAVAPATASTY